MSNTGVENKSDVRSKVEKTLVKHPEVFRQLPEGTEFYRIQPSKYDSSPINYRKDSDTRYSDPDQQVGVYYLGFSQKVATAESFQPGQGVDDQAVSYSMFAQCSLHKLKAARILNVVDVVQLANLASNDKIRDLVQASGQGKEGYALTRQFSQSCMQFGEEVDGLLYPSAVYTETGRMDGCNVVLFGGRKAQVTAIDFKPVLDVQFSSGETPLEFLNSLGVVLE